MAIVETALMLPLLLAVTAMLLTALAIGSTAIQLGDAAHDLARALARGVPEYEVLATATAVVPNASFDISGDQGLVHVQARQEIDIPVPLLDRFSFTIERAVTAPRESG